MINPVLIERDTMTSIGNAIRNKGGATTQLTPGQMPAAINNISGGGEPFIIIGNYLAGCIDTRDTRYHNDWDKIKNLIDYENAYSLMSMFNQRRNLRIREVEEFLSHSMPNLVSLGDLASNTRFIDGNIKNYIFDLTLNSPNCTNYSKMFYNSEIYHLKLTISKHNVDFNMNRLCERSILKTLEIKGPGLNHLISLLSLCYGSSYLQTVTIGDDNTNYSKISDSSNMFIGCRNLKTLTIKGVNVLPLSSTSSIPSTIESIKVPAALVDTYKNATNWSTFANKISAI